MRWVGNNAQFYEVSRLLTSRATKTFSVLDTEQCRQCSSFSDYLKSTKNKLSENAKRTTDNSQPVQQRPDCPLDKDQLGNSSWGLLHTIASKYPAKPTVTEQKRMQNFFAVFSHLYPCEYCASDFRDQLQEDPPKTESQEALSQWLCRMHNKVNVKIGKEEFDCTKVNERWRDGWLDGSCN